MSAAVAPGRSARDATRTMPGALARSKVMALRFVAHLSALGAGRRAGLAARLHDAEFASSEAAHTLDAVRAQVRDAVTDRDVIGPDVDLLPFLASLDQLTRDAAAGDAILAARAADVVRALLVHTDPAYRADFQTLYAPFATDIGFDRLLLG